MKAIYRIVLLLLIGFLLSGLAACGGGGSGGSGGNNPPPAAGSSNWDQMVWDQVLTQLRPVTFHYTSYRNPKGRALQYGLIAEEVAKVATNLVAHSAKGEIETVYYQHLTPMLLNEYQKQQRTIAALAKQTARVVPGRRLPGQSKEPLSKPAVRPEPFDGAQDRPVEGRTATS